MNLKKLYVFLTLFSIAPMQAAQAPSGPSQMVRDFVVGTIVSVTYFARHIYNEGKGRFDKAYELIVKDDRDRTFFFNEERDGGVSVFTSTSEEWLASFASLGNYWELHNENESRFNVYTGETIQVLSVPSYSFRSPGERHIVAIGYRPARHIFCKVLTTGQTITLDVEPSDRIELVKTKIQEKTGISIGRQRLMFAGERLEDVYALFDHSIAEGTTLDLVPPSLLVNTFPIYVRTLTGKRIELNVSPNDSVAKVKQQIQATEGIPPEQQRFITGSRQLEDSFALAEYGIQKESIVHLILRLRGAGVILRLTNQAEIDRLMSQYHQSQTIRDIPISTYHVSCRSYRPQVLEGDEKLAGIVLYAYDGKLDWYLNNVHCRTGYIVIKRSSDVAHVLTNHRSIVHGKVYKSIFGIDANNKKIVGSGFSYDPQNKQWKFNSISFNANNDGYHDGNKEMDKTEKGLVMRSIKKWIAYGTQNTKAITNTGERVVIDGYAYKKSTTCCSW